MFRRADFIRFANIVPAAKACGLRKECRNTMSKICRVCGMMNMDNASVCSKCHSSLGTANMTDQNRFPINGGVSNGGNLNGGNVQQIDPELEKNYAKHQKTQQNSSKILRVLIVVAVVGVVAGYFGVQYYKNNTPPDENWVQENLPEDILYYTLDGEEQKLKFQSLQIQSRTTKDGVDHTKCKVILSDKFLEKTKFINITSKRYDSLGWKVQDWKEYKNEKVTLRAKKKKTVVSYIKKRYQLERIKNFYVEKNTGNYAKTYVCDFKNKYNYLNYSGQFGLWERLKGQDDEEFEDIKNVTGNYNIEKVPATLGTTLQWKLDGTYRYVGDDAYFKVIVKSDGEEGIIWKADYTLYEDDESYHYKLNDTIENPTKITDEDEEQIDESEYRGYEDDEDKPIDLTLGIEYSFPIGNDYWVRFTSDEVSVAKRIYGSWSYGSYEMTKEK